MAIRVVAEDSVYFYVLPSRCSWGRMARNRSVGIRIPAASTALGALNVILYGFQGIRTLLEGQTTLAVSNFLFLAGFLASILMIWKGKFGHVLAMILLILVGYRMSGAVLDASRDLAFRAAHGGMIALAAVFAAAAFREKRWNRGPEGPS
ncbi:MAG: hypothetical protein QXO17_06925 [Nitrososphaerota archaeon]